MFSKDSSEDRIKKLEKSVSEIQSQLTKALCDHPRECIIYSPTYYSEHTANPEYKKECLNCNKDLGRVMESEMHKELAEDLFKKAKVHEDAAQYIKNKSRD